MIQSFARAVIFTSIALIAACTPSSSSVDGTLDVVVSTQILGDVVRQIGGDHVNIAVIIPPDSDPHAYEPVPRDASRLAEADLIVVNGLGLEEALQSLLDANAARVVVASEGVTTIESIQESEEQSKEIESSEHGADPHIWMNPLNVKIWADNIATALTQADPANTEAYLDRAAEYKLELDQLDAWAKEQIDQIPTDRRILVTDHESFGYFAEQYGFQIVGAIISSSSTLAETSAGDLAALEETIRQYGVRVIFVGISMNPALAEQVATDTGALVVPVYTESLTASGGEAPSFLEMIRFDVNAIVSALR